MTDERDALLEAIVAHPDDDLPRLVFADWLDEHDDGDRAEFIRAQVELAAGTADPGRAERLRTRERELLERRGAGWRFAGLIGTQHFIRGFVAHVETSSESILALDPAELARVPVEELRLINTDRRNAELPRLPVWRTVKSLALNNNTYGANGRLAELFGAVACPRLEALSLRNNRIWADGVQTLSQLPVAPQLRRLDLSGNPLGDAGAECLATAPAFAGLRELVLRSDEQYFTDCVHAVGAAALARSRTLTRLTSLNLGGHYLGDAGLIDLAGSPNAAGLRSLDLSYNDIGVMGDSGVVALAESRHLNRLDSLSLRGNRLDRLAVEALLSWPRLGGVREVDLGDCEITAAAVGLIERSAYGGKFRLGD